ncbi:MAG TPA: lysylphosphatidylglycerol synthase transmembrane domain-containing protein [Rubrobacteraceae bacterium]|nr:lysylphosphatidylglycerol synthase transmembrane domain-containing protein [Rubrobacteraceae bacterium]
MAARLVLISVGLGMLLALALALNGDSLWQAAVYALNHPWGILAAFAAYTASFALRTLAWRQFVRERVSLRRLFALIMGGLFLNHAAPAKAGDLARMYALAQWGIAGEKAVASVVLSRLVDLVALLAVLLASWALVGVGGWETFVYPTLFVAGVAVALSILSRLKVPACFGVMGRWVGHIQGASRETTWAALLRSLAFAAPAWVLEAGILLFVVRGIGVELSFAEVVAGTCFAVLVAAIPLAPGALGTYEAGMVAALVSFGVAVEVAFAAAVLTHALKFLYAFVAAPFALGEGLAAVRKGEVKPDEVSVKV